GVGRVAVEAREAAAAVRAGQGAETVAAGVRHVNAPSFAAGCGMPLVHCDFKTAQREFVGGSHAGNAAPKNGDFRTHGPLVSAGKKGISGFYLREDRAG